MKSNSPAKPSPQYTTRSPGEVSVRINAKTTTIKVSRMERTKDEGMKRSTTWLTGRIARDKGVPCRWVLACALCFVMTMTAQDGCEINRILLMSYRGVGWKYLVTEVEISPVVYGISDELWSRW